MPHHRIWLFRPADGREAEFERAYSGEGDWTRLFSDAGGYLGTRLLRPAEAGGLWLTIDSWASEADFDRFQADCGAAYRELDRKLEGLCAEERFVGAFNG